MQDTYEKFTDFSIKQVSAILDIPQTTLRDWEKFFSINILRNDLQQRIYDKNAINLFKEIKRLKAEGLRLKEIKSRINIDSEVCDNSTGKIEVITDFQENNDHNVDLLLKPFTERITALENSNTLLLQESKDLIRENATLKERVSNKDDIINFKDTLVAELKERLKIYESRKWWQVWK